MKFREVRIANGEVTEGTDDGTRRRPWQSSIELHIDGRIFRGTGKGKAPEVALKRAVDSASSTRATPGRDSPGERASAPGGASAALRTDHIIDGNDLVEHTVCSGCRHH